ncbi:ABC transporter permease [Bacillus salitolerans]|uniref:ABC transporter permease n=1 Tax=Bacillus salitolerans TaxID=1437434 RepID=A0ABW4LQS3_9BACI
MLQVLIEVKESIKKRKFFTILIFINTLLFFILLTALYLHYFNVETKTKSFYAQYEGKNIYQLTDNLYGEEEKEYFSSSVGLDRIKGFHEHVSNHEDFIYLNTNLQPLGVTNFKGSDLFLYGYEEGMATPAFTKDGEKYEVVKSIQLNDKIFSMFNLSVENGSIFDKQDYYYSPNKTIPIILGSEYNSIYSIGDKVNFDYIDTKLEGKVIGILPSNTIIPVKNNIEFSIDRYFIIPEFLMDYVSQNNNDLLLQQRHYLNLINGQIYTDMDQLEIRKKINELSEKTDFQSVTVIGANEIGINIMFSMLQHNKILIITLTVFLFLFAVFCIALSLIMKWHINVKRYAIHLISGATINKVFSYSFIEIFFTVFIAVVLVFIFSLSIGILPINYFISMIVLALLLTLLGTFPLYINLTKLRVTMILKRKD